MILVDLNQVMISSFMAQIGSYGTTEPSEDLFRHMVLNALRGYRKKFYSEYGELVICNDDKNYWRKDIYPYYKAHRKGMRDESDLDWNAVFNCLNSVRDELQEFFPYKFIRVERAEADDAIGTLCHEFGAQLGNGDEKILIVSGDKDFIQLQKFSNVQQYDPIRKRWIKHKDPERFLKEHIMKGDRGDGIPNFLSSDDTFVTPNKRQKPLRQKVIDTILGQVSICENMNKTQLLGWQRNKALVDLNEVPEYIRTEVLEQYQSSGNGREHLFNYFVSNRLTQLVENIGDF